MLNTYLWLGLSVADMIVSIDGENASSLTKKEAMQILRNVGDSVQLEVHRIQKVRENYEYFHLVRKL